MAGGPRITSVTRRANISEVFISVRCVNGRSHRTNVGAMGSRRACRSVRAVSSVAGGNCSGLLIEIGPVRSTAGSCYSSRRRVEATVAYKTSVVVLPVFEAYSRVRQLSGYISKGTGVVLLLRAGRTTRGLSRVVSYNNFSRLRVKLGSLRLTCNHGFVFRLLTSNAISELTRGLSTGGVQFNFNNVTEVNCNVLPTRCVVTRRCQLNSHTTVLSEDFYGTSGVRSFGVLRRLFTRKVSQVHRFRRITRGCAQSRFVLGREGMMSLVSGVIQKL